MRKPILLMLLLFASMLSVAQDYVNVSFTSNTTDGLYCPFTTVNATNVTRGWTETLSYPDTVLVLANTVGLSEHKDKAFHLGDAFPNPFKGETYAFLELSEDSDVLLQLIRVDGVVVASRKLHLAFGTSRITVRMSAAHLAFLSATTNYGRQVVKLINMGRGTTDALDVDFVSTTTKSLDNPAPIRLNVTGEFEPGDLMRYEAQLLDGGSTLYSSAVTQALYGDEIVTLLFDLAQPIVRTNSVTEITQTSAICGGNVTDAGGLMVMARGVCWGTQHNPTVSGSHTSDGMGVGEFTSHMAGLTAGRTYYVRAYAVNRLGTSYGNEMSFTTEQIPNYTISLSANPSNGGTVTGGGSYQQGQSCTVHATANTGYTFVKWTENGNQVSANANYTFIVAGNRTLVAHFTVSSYVVSASANPEGGGVIAGAGGYEYGQSCTLSATANAGYTFLKWTENGTQVSTNANYTFTVMGNRTLVAQFQVHSHTITATANPANGGSVTGGGTYDYGQTCTVTASPSTGYNFVNWTENGTQVSSSTSYSFTVTSNRTIVANFAVQVTLPTVTTNQVTNITQTTATGGGNVTNTGGGIVTTRGVCWSTSHNPTVSTSHTTDGTGMGSFTSSITDLTANTTYYVRAYATNSAGTAYGSEVSFTTLQNVTLPTVTTNQVTNITQTTATGGGNVTNTGGGIVTARGVCWSTSHNPIVSNSHTTNGTGMGSFTSSITDLTANTTYYVRAYATNSAGTAYGNEVSFTTLNNSGNHEYVDLGLPSGTLWATCNVGANTPEGYGNHFAWGETQPKGDYLWNTYQYCNGSSNTLTKYCNNTNYGYNGFVDNLTTLLPEDDAATANWGDDWRMPTKEQWEELRNNTTYTWTIQNGVNGRLFIASNGNRLFLPAAGCWTTFNGNVGSYGYYWSNSLYTDDPSNAWTCYFNSNGCSVYYGFYRDCGQSVRAVRNEHATYSITVSSSPANGGTVSGGGIYQQGHSCTVSATAASGYTFLCWAENGNQVSFNANYTFIVTGNCALVAQFQTSITTPIVTTAQVTDIQQTTATGGGNVTSDGGSTVMARGLCWSTSHNPTLSNSHTTNGTGTGSFTSNISNLTANTTYYVRAYATNSAGTAYGNEVSFTTLNNSGNHEFVNLGLPSGTLWATCNVGANTPEGYGNYFAWGETQPKGDYSWNTYQYCMGSENTLTKYCNNSNYGYNGFTDNLTTLLPEDDAATVNWGDDWRMPTKEEWEELRDNTTHTWAIQNGVNGMLFVASNGNSIFLPAAGYCTNFGPVSGTYGYYRSNSLYTGNPSKAWTSYFSSNGYGMGVNYDFYRMNGFSVRAVRSATSLTVVTNSVNNITQTSATGGGNVISAGGSTVTARGVCWSTSHNPTVSNSHTTNGTGTGGFTSSITNLTANTTYYVRAYATNSAGTAYGNEVSFTTLQDVTVPTVTTSQVTSIAQTTANAGGNVTNAGGGTVTARGVCWSTSHNPTLSNSHTTNGTGTGAFASNITNLTANTTYYVRAYATNSAGTAYGSEVSFTTLQNVSLPTVTTSQVTNITQTTATCGGNVTNAGGGIVTARGVCWSTSHNPTISNNHTTNGTGTGSFTSSITNLTANTTYYVRAYATNSAGTAYGSEVSFTTLQNVTLPTVTTSQMTNITQTTATGGGNVTSDGGGIVTARGVCWSTSHNPTISNNHTTNGTGTGSFTSSITNLTGNTTYYVRAYATNNAGTAYGSEVSFTTQSGSSNGYVDLGLPSGLLWAACNAGASTPEGHGRYVSWGEIQSKESYDWSNYRYCQGNYTMLTKYCTQSYYGYNGFTDDLIILQYVDDAADYGGRTPTKEEWEELYTNTTSTWTTRNGVNGRLFTGSNGNSIFLPAVGDYTGSSLYNPGNLGYYWSSSLIIDAPYLAYAFCFHTEDNMVHSSIRSYGLPVRAVRSTR